MGDLVCSSGHTETTIPPIVVSKVTLILLLTTTDANVATAPVFKDYFPPPASSVVGENPTNDIIWKNPNTLIPAATYPTIFRVPLEPALSPYPVDGNFSTLNPT